MNLPNAISVLRIFLVLALFFIPVMSEPFQIVYILSFITDILDGFIARLTNNVTELGSTLDSFADIVYAVAFLALVFPWMEPSTFMVAGAAAILVAKAIPFFWVRIATGSFHTFHNIFAKAGFFGLAILPFAFMHIGEPACWVLSVVLCLADILDFIMAYEWVRDHRSAAHQAGGEQGGMP